MLLKIATSLQRLHGIATDAPPPSFFRIKSKKGLTVWLNCVILIMDMEYSPLDTGGGDAQQMPRSLLFYTGGEKEMEMTPKMFKAVSLLYEGKSKKEIAEELKISPATLGRWLNDPDFKAATVSVASQQIGQLVPDAVQTIQKVMHDDMAKPAERLNAARTVLEYARVLDREEMDREITVRVEYV